MQAHPEPLLDRLDQGSRFQCRVAGRAWRSTPCLGGRLRQPVAATQPIGVGALVRALR